MNVRSDALKRDEHGSLISADKVEGTPVHSRDGEDLGTIERIMIDKPSGKVAYAVMAFGGVLGMGKERRSLPWQVLTYDTSQEAYVVDMDTERLRSAPALEEDNEGFDWSNRDWGQRLHDYYGASPYWSDSPR